MDDMKNSVLWVLGPRFYEQLRAVDDMNDYGSWA